MVERTQLLNQLRRSLRTSPVTALYGRRATASARLKRKSGSGWMACCRPSWYGPLDRPA